MGRVREGCCIMGGGRGEGVVASWGGEGVWHHGGVVASWRELWHHGGGCGIMEGVVASWRGLWHHGGGCGIMGVKGGLWHHGGEGCGIMEGGL